MTTFIKLRLRWKHIRIMGDQIKKKYMYLWYFKLKNEFILNKCGKKNMQMHICYHPWVRIVLSITDV